MAHEPSPAFQFYPKDFLTDEHVMAMSLEEIGAYWLLCCFCWTEGSLPTNTTHLARMLHIPVKKFQKMWPAITTCFRQTDQNRLIHPRLEREREKQTLWRQQHRDAANTRWEHARAMRPQSERTTLLSSSPSASSSSSPIHTHTQDNNALDQRAGAFCERYRFEWYPQYRGVPYVSNEQNDFQAARVLCQTYPDDVKLGELVKVWLNIPDSNEFVRGRTRTITMLKAKASVIDERLRKQ